MPPSKKRSRYTTKSTKKSTPAVSAATTTEEIHGLIRKLKAASHASAKLQAAEPNNPTNEQDWVKQLKAAARAREKVRAAELKKNPDIEIERLCQQLVEAQHQVIEAENQFVMLKEKIGAAAHITPMHAFYVLMSEKYPHLYQRYLQTIRYTSGSQLP